MELNRIRNHLRHTSIQTEIYHLLGVGGARLHDFMTSITVQMVPKETPVVGQYGFRNLFILVWRMKLLVNIDYFYTRRFLLIFHGVF